jgi:iron complex transport system permease protein
MRSATLRRLVPSPLPPGSTRRYPRRAVLGALAVLVLMVATLAAGIGAFAVTPAEIAAILAHRAGIGDGTGYAPQQEAVLFAIRLPRVALALMAGGALALAGAVLQGLFRNPLADPALIGVSAGAALAAAWTIVLGATWLPGLAKAAGPFTLPLAAFAGALGATAIVFQLARTEGRVSMAVMLLGGVAINALAGAGIGLATFVASDEQLRSITFWQLGSLAGANGPVLGVLALLAGAACLGLLRLAPALDAYALGEAEARHLGVDVRRMQRTGVAFSALAVGAVTGVTGIVGFVGLVAPHLMRLACGPSHRLVLPGAMLLGAALVAGADIPARTLAAPAELPIGVLTALVGAPVFLALLMRTRRGWTL